MVDSADSLVSIGLMGKAKLYDGVLGEMEGLSYQTRLTAPVSKTTHEEILTAIRNSDINYLKNSLKYLKLTAKNVIVVRNNLWTTLSRTFRLLA